MSRKSHCTFTVINITRLNKMVLQTFSHVKKTKKNTKKSAKGKQTEAKTKISNICRAKKKICEGQFNFFVLSFENKTERNSNLKIRQVE